MNNDMINTSAELEQMRSEFEILKKKLENQDIVNDKMIRLSMRDKAGILDRQELMQYVFAALACVLAPNFHFSFGASWYFVGATIILMFVCVFFTWKFHSKVKASDMASADLLTVQKNVRQLKKDYSDWLKYGFGLITIWLGALCYEIFKNTDDLKFAYFMFASCMIGGIIGATIGLKMHYKVIRTCDDIISDLEGE